MQNILGAVAKGLTPKGLQTAPECRLMDARHAYVGSHHDQIVRHVLHQGAPKESSILTQNGRHISHDGSRGITGALDGCPCCCGCFLAEPTAFEHLVSYAAHHSTVRRPAWHDGSGYVCHWVGDCQGCCFGFAPQLRGGLSCLHSFSQVNG